MSLDNKYWKIMDNPYETDDYGIQMSFEDLEDEYNILINKQEEEMWSNYDIN
jgi:hypothetical protein